MPAGTGIARRAAGSAIGPVERRLLRKSAVRRSVAASVAIGLVSAASVVVQAVALAALLAGAMGSTTDRSCPRSSGWAGRRCPRPLCPGRRARRRAGRPDREGGPGGACSARRWAGHPAVAAGWLGATWRRSPAMVRRPRRLHRPLPPRPGAGRRGPDRPGGGDRRARLAVRGHRRRRALPLPGVRLSGGPVERAAGGTALEPRGGFRQADRGHFRGATGAQGIWAQHRPARAHRGSRRGDSAWPASRPSGWHSSRPWCSTPSPTLCDQTIYFGQRVLGSS